MSSETGQSELWDGRSSSTVGRERLFRQKVALVKRTSKKHILRLVDMYLGIT
jgi:hypothetical protein